jgi:ubiquinone/menaquinone biosynthesis C-methylase UbiE
MKTKIRDAYNVLGDYYYKSRKDKSGVSYFFNELLEKPTTLKLLGNVKEKKILDLGCGPGIYARELVEKGAKVKGLDISKKLIEIAKEECPQADFKVGDAEKLPYKNNEFDIVLGALFLDHIDNWNPILSEVKRVLKKNGLFVFSGYNPVTESMKKEKWFFKKFKVIRDYFKEEWHRGKWKEPGKEAEVAHHHKTYGTIVRTIVKNGFEILDYQDAYPAGDEKKLFPKQYDETSNYPKFCTWKVRKK